MSESNRVNAHPDETLEYNLDLLITSLGYKGSPMSGFEELKIKFDRNKIANSQGRVLDTQENTIPGLYTTGWIGKGAEGVILATMTNSFAVAENILKDLHSLPPKTTSIPSLENVNSTTWEDAERILSFEEQEGKMKDKPREKLLTVQEMLRVVQH